MKKALIITIISLTATCFGEIQTIERPNPWAQLGSECGKAFGDGIKKGAEDYRCRQQEKEDAERAYQMEAASNERKRNEAEANNARLAVLLEGYTPARHSEYVLRIMQSKLPQDLKQQTIQQLDLLARRAG